ncbi:MAG: MFS transporter [Chthoniobacterales bacterium]
MSFLNKEQRRIVVLASVGGMLEFYDFTIYGLFATYFAEQFFPSNNSFTTIISTYAVFFIGYVARPLGGIIFSHLGDEIGRKTVMIVTMILMGLASLGLGLLPTYSLIGLWAPVLMLLLRLLQGLAIGGELPSMIVYIAESLPDQRGIAMGGIFAGTIGGLIPGMLINLLLTYYLTVQQIHDFGWRIPFILGSLLCFVGYQVRNKLHETAAFSNLKQHYKFPLGELVRHHFGKVLLGAGLVSIMATSIILAIIFMPTYLTKILKFQPSQVSQIMLWMTVLSIASVYIGGVLTTRFSPYVLMKSCLILLVVASAACYLMLANNHQLSIALALFAIAQGSIACLPPLFLSYLFPLPIRLSGVALSYNIGFVFFGGLTPIVVTTLIGYTHMNYLIPFLCLLVVALLAFFCLAKVKNYCDVSVDGNRCS